MCRCHKKPSTKQIIVKTVSRRAVGRRKWSIYFPQSTKDSGRPGEQLPKEHEDEAGVVLEVSIGHAPRLGSETKYPFKAAALHPSRSPSLAAGDEVESGPNGKHHGRNPAHVIDDPVLLPGASDANEEQLHAGRGDSLDDSLVFLGSERSEWRAFSIDHVEVGVQQAHSTEKRIENGLAAAIKSDRNPVFFGSRQQSGSGIRAANSLGALLPQCVKRPYEGHSVWKSRAGVIQLKKESRIVNSFHNHMDIGEKQRSGVPFRSPCKAVMNYFVVAADSDIDPKDGPGNERFHWFRGRH